MKKQEQLALKSRHHISSEEQHFVFVLLQGDQGIHEACDPNNPPHIEGQRAFAASPSPAKLEPFQGKSLTSITKQILDNRFGNHIMFYNSCSQVSKFSARWRASSQILQWDPSCHHGQCRLEFACTQFRMEGHRAEEHVGGADVHFVQPSGIMIC